MKRRRLPLSLLISVLTLSLSRPAWTLTVAPAGSPEKPVRTAMDIVQGRPAIAWVDTAAGTVNFVRALDTSGTAWGTPAVVDQGSLDAGLCLRTVNGNPALCYADTALNKLKFLRAADAEGNIWNDPVAFDAQDPTGQLTMEIVQGNPAVIVTSKSGLLRYIRATDANGSAWGIVSSVGNSVPDYIPPMKVVQGHPAFASGHRLNGLMYRSAADSTGNFWEVAKNIFFTRIPGSDLKSLSASLQLIAGNPAIAFVAASGPLFEPTSSWSLNFVRSSAAQGNNWGTANSPVSGVVPLGQPSLAEINGKPAIAWFAGASSSQLKMIQATNFDGTEWDPPFTLDSGEPGGYHPTLTVVDGRPAICYSGMTPPAVKFLRASDAAGSVWPPGIAVASQGTVIPNGGTAAFGAVMPGFPKTLEFTVRNPDPRNEVLLITGINIDGPDAAEFSIVTTPETALPAASTATFSVRYSPSSLRADSKSAVLHISNNSQTPPGAYDILLTDKRESLAQGTLDQSFKPAQAGNVQCLTIQADGKVLVGSAVATNYFLNRYLPDGSPDLLFFPPILNGGVRCIALQKDGKILIGGGFTEIDGIPRTYVARLLPDGSVDESFAFDTSGFVYSLLIQPDGKILAGGDPDIFAGRSGLFRLNADGSLDDTFNAAPNDTVSSLALQPDGKILAGGLFTKVSSIDALHIARFNSDGSPDGFPASFLSPARCLAIQTDGGFFAAGENPGYLGRFFSDGRRDLSLPILRVTSGGVWNVIPQTDGAFLLGGEFTEWGGFPHANLVRINAAAQTDAGFFPVVASPPGEVSYIALNSMVVQADGRIIVGGGFTGVGGVAQANLARVENGPAFSVLIAANGSTVRWMRGGTAPEVRDVTFDLKPDGALEWSPLGAAHRIPGGWELSGLTLPATGTLRAQAYAGGSVIEGVAAILAPLESWKHQYFNTPVFTGDAADNADPDQDGLTNFTEFAFDLNPVDRSSNILPEFKRTGNTLTASFSTPAGRENILYGAEWSAAMQPGTWTAIPDTGTQPLHRFTMPLTEQRKFARFVIRAN